MAQQDRRLLSKQQFSVNQVMEKSLSKTRKTIENILKEILFEKFKLDALVWEEDHSGKACWLEISSKENLFPFSNLKKIANLFGTENIEISVNLEEETYEICLRIKDYKLF